MALARREKLTGKLPHQTGVKIGLLEKHASELSGLHEDKDRVMALLAEVDRMKDLDPRDCANTSADAETSPRATVANRTDIRSRTVTAWHGRYHVSLVVSGRAQVQCLDMTAAVAIGSGSRFAGTNTARRGSRTEVEQASSPDGRLPVRLS